MHTYDDDEEPAKGIAGYTPAEIVVTEDMMRDARALAGVCPGQR